MNTDELVALIQAIKEAETKSNEELDPTKIIDTRNPREENKKYENSREGELLQELDETRDTGRRIKLIAEIRRERASNLNNLNDRLNAEIGRLEGILNEIRNRDIRAEVLNSNDLEPNRIIDTRNPEEKRQYENSREGELLQELDETRDIHRRREIIADILQERTNKLEQQRRTEMSNIEELLSSLRNREFDKIIEQYSNQKANEQPVQDLNENENIEEQEKQTNNSNNNPYKNLSDEELKAKLEELQADYDDEYQLRVHEENGMEEHEDYYLKNLRGKIDKIKEELDSRESSREDDEEYNFRVHGQNGMENNEETQEPVEQQVPVSTENPYNKALSEYDDIFDMYDQDLETLYELQKQYENGEIPYSEYEKHADYMVERYRYIMGEYEKINGMYEKSKPEANPFEKLTDEELQAKLEELENDAADERYYLTHLANGMINEGDSKRLDDIESKIAKIKEEQQQRKNNPYKNLSNEELQAKLEELENDYNEEYRWREGHESGMEEHDDDFIKDYENKKKKIQDELDRRNNKDLEKPRKPEQPMMIKEKENTEPVPEPVPEPIPEPVPPVPTPEPEPNKLPIRSFWEIYNSTATEHSGSIATTLYNMAHMKILPHKDEDTMTKILSGITIPLKALAKVVALAPNAILGTNAKMDEMRENIANLSPQEFDALVMRSADIKEKYDGANIKAEYDTDCLSPQFMKQYKVSNLYLQAVSERLHVDRDAEIEMLRQKVRDCYDTIAELEEKKGTRPLTPDEQVRYDSATSDIQKYTIRGEKLVNEKKEFDRGAKEKSSSFKNIRGWFLAKFNPDNRVENEAMAEMSEQRRIAGESGDYTKVHEITNLMTQYSIAKTEIKGKGPDSIDIGKYSIEDSIEMLDRGEDTRGRLLLANAAAIATLVNMAHQLKNAAEIESTLRTHNDQIKQHNADITQHNQSVADLDTKISADKQALSDYANDVAQHNADITAANNANSSISYAGQTKIPGMEQAQEAYIGIGRQALLDSNERGTLDGNNWDVSSAAYKKADAITHAVGKSVTAATNSAIQQGDRAGALDILYKYQSDYPIDYSVTREYMANNPQYDYSAIDFNAPADYKTMHDFLTQGDVTYSGTVAGQMVSQIKDVPAMKIFTETIGKLQPMSTMSGLNLSTKINWLPAIMASANAMYQGVKQGFRDGIKVAREKLAEKQNGEVIDEYTIGNKEDGREEQ